MIGRSVRRILLVVAMLALPVLGYAQEAVLSGTVSDSTGGVLPGVTVTAVHEASGNTFVGVADESGVFRIPVRVGAYKITLELSGFATIARTGINLLAGQTVSVPLQMTPASVQESITVTAEVPLVNVAQTNPSGNIDPKQFAELPA